MRPGWSRQTVVALGLVQFLDPTTGIGPLPVVGGHVLGGDVLGDFVERVLWGQRPEAPPTDDRLVLGPGCLRLGDVLLGHLGETFAQVLGRGGCTCQQLLGVGGGKVAGQFLVAAVEQRCAHHVALHAGHRLGTDGSQSQRGDLVAADVRVPPRNDLEVDAPPSRYSPSPPSMRFMWKPGGRSYSMRNRAASGL